MPAAIRRRSGGTSLARETASLGLTPLARVRTPARVAVATPGTSAPPGTPVNPAEECCICILDLGSKRSVTLQPCAHRFHETCAHTWMETRESRSAQTCPLCRARTRRIIDESGTSAPPSYPFGASGEPLRTVLIQEEQPENLQRLLRETNTRLSRCGELERNEGKSDEYMEDIRCEKLQLERRATILTTMIEQHSRGEWTEPPASLLRSPAIIMAELQAQLDQLRRVQQEQRFRQHLNDALAARDAPVDPAPPRRADRLAQLELRLLRLLPARRPASAAAPLPAAADAANWTQSRPATVPRPFNAGRPTAASAARAAAVASSSSNNGAAPAAAARRSTAARSQPVLQRAAVARRDTAVQTTAAAAGPARRRSRLSGVSTTPGARAPHPYGRVAVQMAAEPAPNYTETPRRSARIAALRGGAGARLL